MQPRPASNPPTSVTYFETILFTMTLEENTGPLRQPAWEGTHRTLFTSPQQQCGGADLHHLCLLSSCSSLCLFRFLIFAQLLLIAQGAFQPESLASIVPHSCLPLFPPDPHWPFTYIPQVLGSFYWSLYLQIDVLTQQRGELYYPDVRKAKRLQGQRNLGSLTQIKLGTTDEKGINCGKLFEINLHDVLWFFVAPRLSENPSMLLAVKTPLAEEQLVRGQWQQGVYGRPDERQAPPHRGLPLGN